MEMISALVVIAACLAVVAGMLHIFVLFLSLWSTRSGRSREIEARLDTIAESAERTDRAIREQTGAMRTESEGRGRELRKEVSEQILKFGDSLRGSIEQSRKGVDSRLEDAARTQSEFADKLRAEVRQTISAFGDGLKADIKALADANDKRQEALRATVEERLEKLRNDNEAKLESMRATVEEKLQGTLEKRLGESFALVGERLELVHRGLGEMQTLALGVGDLKRVLSNVKDRGGWAEVQLGSMLDQLLAREQYLTNVKIDPGATEAVEFAVRLPGQSDNGDVLLPIDAKFPKETYERLVHAWEAGVSEDARAAAAELASVIEGEAKRISSKYIRPPHSTDFAVMYLPTEGLFAEAMRSPGLVAKLQSKYRVAIAGPTTLAALLNSLQMGFRTLAIQQRSSEVWRVLGEAKAEFARYGDVWDKIGKQLGTVQKSVEEAGKRTRAVSRKLRDVEVINIPSNAPIEVPFVDDGEGESEEGEAERVRH